LSNNVIVKIGYPCQLSLIEQKTDTLRIDLVGIGLKCSRANNKGQLLSQLSAQ